VKRRGKEFIHGAILDDLPGIHDSRELRRLRDDAQIVGNQDNRSPTSPFSLLIRSGSGPVWSRQVPFVGSSASMRRGLHDSAMAIITRCLIPPLIWCG